MNRIEPVLQMEDIAEIFRVSPQTVARWLRDAKRGENSFPQPLNTPGRKLIWSRDSVEMYLNENQQVVNVPQLESAIQQRKRHNAALAEIERKHGIPIKPQNRKRDAKL